MVQKHRDLTLTMVLTSESSRPQPGLLGVCSISILTFWFCDKVDDPCDLKAFFHRATIMEEIFISVDKAEYQNQLANLSLHNSHIRTLMIPRGHCLNHSYPINNRNEVQQNNCTRESNNYKATIQHQYILERVKVTLQFPPQY